MKVFDLSQLKKTARVKEPTPLTEGISLNNNKSYSQIHKSPTKSSIREPILQSFYLSRWGKNIDGKITSKNQQLPWTNVGQGIISTSVGEEHVLIVNNKHQCFGYGSNSYGQVALQAEHIHRPTQLTSLKQMKIVNIVCGSYHSFVQNSKGEIYGFGMNMKGQLGIGNYQSKKKPSLIYSLLPYGIKNPKSNFFIETNEYKKKLKKTKQEGTQLSNISNLMNKIVNTQSECEQKNAPIFLLSQDEVINQFACGPLHSLVLSNKQRLFACGYGQKYALGIGKCKSINEFTEVKVKGSISKIDKIQCGIATSGFLSEGRLYIAGTVDKKIFQYFTPLNFSDQITDFKLAADCILVLNRKGEVYKLGKNLSSNSSSCQSFQKVTQFEGSVKLLFSGTNCFFAVTDTGLCYGWGDNLNNQITGVQDEAQIQTPKLLKIPICMNESISIVPGNGTTFLLSGKPLQSPSKTQRTVENQQEISSFVEEMPLKTSISQIELKKKNTSKYSHSNIYKTEEKNLLSEMGIKPRTFNISMEIDFSELVLESQISEGGYGIIYKGLWRQTTVAIKMFKIESENGVKDFFSQCAAMQALRHPNIVMFLGACTKPPNFAIVLEYCGKGSLWSTIQNLQVPLTWQERKRFAIQTAKGVNYLHTSNPPIIHRDLKSLNLLLDDSYKVKLADFGWTKGLENYMTGKIGTYQWMAPQVIGSQKYSQKADVFSYGIILWQIASRQPPFKNLSGLQVSMQVLNNDLRPKVPKNTPEQYVRLMKKCWDRDPSKRPSFKQIIKQFQLMKF